MKCETDLNLTDKISFIFRYKLKKNNDPFLKTPDSPNWEEISDKLKIFQHFFITGLNIVHHMIAHCGLSTD